MQQFVIKQIYWLLSDKLQTFSLSTIFLPGGQSDKFMSVGDSGALEAQAFMN